MSSYYNPYIQMQPQMQGQAQGQQQQSPLAQILAQLPGYGQQQQPLPQQGGGMQMLGQPQGQQAGGMNEIGALAAVIMKILPLILAA